MATNNLEASGTLLWIRASGLCASNHQEVGRNRKLVLRLSCRDSPQKIWRSISLNCAIRDKQWTTGRRPREFLWVPLIVSSYIVMHWVSVQKWTRRTIPKMGKEKTLHLKNAILVN